MFRRLLWVCLILMAAGTARTAPPADSSSEYKLRAGDVISVDVWGFSDFTVSSVPVRPDGKISFPTIGEVYVVGQTPAQLSRILALGISKYLKDPKVTVTLVTSGAQKYFVTGSVASPGAFPLAAQTGVREAVVAAGDLGLDANDQQAVLLRNGERIPVDLAGALHGDASKNLIMEAGDTLSIDKALVTFVGAVGATGQQPLRRGSTLSQAIAAVGGLRDGADQERVQILRGDKTLVANMREITADPTRDIALLPGDIIKVDLADDRTVPVFITGSVGHQSMYRYLPGRRDTLQDAINWAGGVSGDADLGRVKIRRTIASGDTVETAYDLRTVEGRSVRLQPNDYIDVTKKKRSQAASILSSSLGVGLSLYSIFKR
ncbi:MAG TPA: polysaccharide biosynthesis/export family protein [Armatimonadota bacterium]|jgi:polysaccharide export outer membrane protein